MQSPPFPVTSSILGPNNLLNTTFCSQRPSVSFPPAVSATNFHTHTKQEAKYRGALYLTCLGQEALVSLRSDSVSILDNVPIGPRPCQSSYLRNLFRSCALFITGCRLCVFCSYWQPFLSGEGPGDCGSYVVKYWKVEV